MSTVVACRPSGRSRFLPLSLVRLEKPTPRLPAATTCPPPEVTPPTAAPAAPTGFAALDAALPGGGWPHRVLTELTDGGDDAALRLLAPALASALRAGRPVMLFDPPDALSAALLARHGLDAGQLLVVDGRVASSPGASSLWVLEQALSSGTVGAVLAWLPRPLPAGRLHGLEQAVRRHDGPAFLVRAAAAADERHEEPVGSGASRLRVALQSVEGGGLAVSLPGGSSGAAARIELAVPGGFAVEPGRTAPAHPPCRLSVSLHGGGRETLPEPRRVTPRPVVRAAGAGGVDVSVPCDGGIVLRSGVSLAADARSAVGPVVPATVDDGGAFDAAHHRPLRAAVFVDLGG